MHLSQCPCIPACESKGDYPCSGHLLEAGVLEEFESSGEMPFHSGKVALVVADHHLERVCTTKKTAGTSFARSKFKCLIAEIAGSWEVTRRKCIDAHRDHQI